MNSPKNLTTKQKAEAGLAFWDMNSEDSETEEILAESIARELTELGLDTDEAREISLMTIDAFNVSSKFDIAAKYPKFSSNKIYLEMISLLKGGSWEV